MVLLKLVTNYDDSMFMVHVKLSCVRHNVLMRHKKCRHISDAVMGRVSWISWVMGHVGHGSRIWPTVSAVAESLVLWRIR